ncbi:hypothetical protein [Chitinophaga ginsengisoli]|uniref:Uncharacterized protein n=1 Tax=Chitinophaga ginsengisoli TaxID=363837 RepID=A0A2P8FNN2_9BACT|nr:hypothetical protein [Chitinophaga ginsengisoli]PSL23332.1 hypothetical protein CLV42_11847 [Chitinophaga ginsengisoli]
MKKKAVQKLHLGKIKIASLNKNVKGTVGRRISADPDNPCDPIHTMLGSCRVC